MPGYVYTLSNQVDALRSKLRDDTKGMLAATGQRRQMQLQALMEALHEQLNGFHRSRVEAQYLRAAARHSACADRRSEVAQLLHSNTQLRSSVARADQRARTYRLTELRKQAQQILSSARVHLAARAARDRSMRADFMQSLRVRVSAMTEAFHSAHASNCTTSRNRREAALLRICNFVSTLTGRPHSMTDSCASPTAAQPSCQLEEPPLRDSPPPVRASYSTSLHSGTETRAAGPPENAVAADSQRTFDGAGPPSGEEGQQYADSPAGRKRSSAERRRGRA